VIGDGTHSSLAFRGIVLQSFASSPDRPKKKKNITRILQWIGETKLLSNSLGLQAILYDVQGVEGKKQLP